MQPLVEHPDPLLNERAEIIALVENSEPGKPVFHFTRHRFWKIMRKRSKTADIAEYLAHPHILKHSIAMQTIETVGIEKLKTYLGHRSMNSTAAYLVVDQDVASRAIAAAFQPKK
jgi:site-specific recombinase XerD